MTKITDLIDFNTNKNLNDSEESSSYKEYKSKLRPVKMVDAGTRFAHFIIDFMAFQIILYLVGVLFVLRGESFDFGFTLFITLLTTNNLSFIFLLIAYYVVCEYFWQKTPGKYLSKTVVIDEYANKPELRAIILRTLLRLIPFEPFSCFGKNSCCWHDSWSNTWVVTEEERDTLLQLLKEQGTNK